MGMEHLWPGGQDVTETAADHVRLAYHYLDQGDLDGYGSLLEEDTLLDRPGGPSAHGREEVLRRLAGVGPGRHELHRLIAEGDQVAVAGSWTADGAAPIGFAEFFDVSRSGLLLASRRFYDSPPG